MKCLACKEEMEYEHVSEPIPKPKNYKGKPCPAAIYYCNGCGREWLWVKGRRIKLLSRDVRPMFVKDIKHIPKSDIEDFFSDDSFFRGDDGV